jgi:hypothetical protein
MESQDHGKKIIKEQETRYLPCTIPLMAPSKLWNVYLWRFAISSGSFGGKGLSEAGCRLSATT